MSLFRLSCSSALAAIVMSGSRMIVLAVVARRVSPAGFGQFTYIQWLVDIAILACSFGTPGAVARYAAEFGHNPAQLAGFLRRWRWWAALGSLSGGIATVIGAWATNIDVGPTGYAILLVWSASQGIWAMETAALTGCQRFDLIALANVIFGLIAVIGLLLLPTSEHRPVLLFGLMAMASAGAASVGMAMIIRRTARSVPDLHETQWRAIRSYAANTWVTALLSNLVWSRGEYPLVRAMMGDAGLAHYSAAMTLFAGGAQFVMLGVSGLTPYLTALWGQGLTESTITTARRIMDLQLLICGIVALGLTLFADEILEITFGPAYRHAGLSLSVLALGLVAFAVSAPNHLLQLTTDARFGRNAAVAGVLLLFTLALAFAPMFGLVGAGLARSTTMLSVALITTAMTRSKWGSPSASIWNLLSAAGLVSAGIAIVAWRPGLGLPERVIVFAVCGLLLGLLVRGVSGKRVIQTARHGISLSKAPQAETSNG
jgi:O-antigen/teichoic acid export membrane protein